MVPMFEHTTKTNGCEVIQLGAIYVCTFWKFEKIMCISKRMNFISFVFFRYNNRRKLDMDTNV
jgi:hypothetical protein